jgi:hypothetical protein
MTLKRLYLIFVLMFFLTCCFANAQQTTYVEFPNGQIRRVLLSAALPSGTTQARYNYQGQEYIVTVLDPNALMRNGTRIQDIPDINTISPFNITYPAAPAMTPEQLISGYLGVQTNTAGIIFSALIIFLGILVVGVVTKSDIAVLLTALVLTAIFGVLNYLPIWVCLLVGMLLAVWLIERGGAR